MYNREMLVEVMEKYEEWKVSLTEDLSDGLINAYVLDLVVTDIKENGIDEIRLQALRNCSSGVHQFFTDASNGYEWMKPLMV